MRTREQLAAELEQMADEVAYCKPHGKKYLSCIECRGLEERAKKYVDGLAERWQMDSLEEAFMAGWIARDKQL